MLTIYIGTFCRPDLVDLTSRAVKATCTEECRVVVQLQPRALTRQWAAVDEVIHASSRRGSWREIDRTGDAWLFLEDDCVPILPWSSESFPNKYVCRKDGGKTIVFSGAAAAMTVPRCEIDVARMSRKSLCPEVWGDLCHPAKSVFAESIMGGTFLHLDKSSNTHPDSPEGHAKRTLVELISQKLGLPPPDALSEKELEALVAAKMAERARNGDRITVDETNPAYPRERKPGLGDMVASGLSAVGITKERVSRAIGKPCGCENRQQWLNEAGKRLGIG